MPWRLIPQDSGSVSWGSKLKRREQSEVTRLIPKKIFALAPSHAMQLEPLIFPQ